MPDPFADANRATQARVSVAIEHYLVLHPEAADSAAGIAQWWLTGLGVEAPLTVVESALTRLAQEGRVRREELPGGQVIWRASR